MARTARIKKTASGVTYYHLMSRTNNRQFLFKEGNMKTALVDTLIRTAEFSGIGIEAYVAMDNHFHVVVKVARSDEPIGEAELLRRIGVLRGTSAREALELHWMVLRKEGRSPEVAAEQDRLRARMNDISEFMKTFKEEFDRKYKGEHEYCGSIWSGRFMSTLIEDGEYLARCKRYVIYNPIRAKIVGQAKDYAWSGCRSDKIASHEGPVPAGVGSGMGRMVTEMVELGADSRGWGMRRVVQIGAGKIFGSRGFVARTVFELSDLFTKGIPREHLVWESAEKEGTDGYSTHGWKLAAREEAK